MVGDILGGEVREGEAALRVCVHAHRHVAGRADHTLGQLHVRAEPTATGLQNTDRKSVMSSESAVKLCQARVFFNQQIPGVVFLALTYLIQVLVQVRATKRVFLSSPRNSKIQK